MTSFSRLSGPKRASSRFLRSALLAALLVTCLLGCGPSDGLRELEAGRAAYEAGDLKKAKALLAKSEQCNGTNVDTQVSLALVSLKLGEIAEAERHIVRAEEFASGDTDVRLLSAQVAWHQKDYEKAASLYRALADDATLDATVRARGWTGLGIVQKTTDAYDLARVSFLRAIRLDRRSAPARYHLGQLYRYPPFAYPEAALEQFEGYVRLHEEADARVQDVQRAVIPGLRDLIARMASERPGATSRNSTAGTAALSRAEAALRASSYKTALAAYREALAADPLAYPAALGVARLTAKTDASAAGQKKALENYRLACSLRPSAVSTLLEAGRLAERLGQSVQAREIYSRAVAANPASLEALDGLIRAFTKAGDRKAAGAYQAYRDSIQKAVRR